jgi:hypothetical protein
MILRPLRARKLKDFIYFSAQNYISFLSRAIYVSFLGSSKYTFEKVFVSLEIDLYFTDLYVTFFGHWILIQPPKFSFTCVGKM